MSNLAGGTNQFISLGGVAMIKGAIIFVVVLFGPIAAFACSCGPVGPACEEIFDSDNHTVFLGRVESIRMDWLRLVMGNANYVVTLKVAESYKGESGSRLRIRTPTNGAACGFHFERGKDYVIYAHKHLGQLFTSICSRTLPMKAVANELPYLRSYRSLPQTGRIYGTVKRYTYDRSFVPKYQPSIMDHYLPPEEYYMAMAAMKGQKVLIEGANFKQAGVVDDEGRYEVTGLQPGEYSVTVQFPRNLAGSRTVKVDVRARGCAETSFRAQPSGEISGRITDPNGKPLGRVFVFLTYADQGDKAKEEFRREYTGDDGSYKFEHVPAGEYLLGVNTIEGWHRRGDFPPTFYPGAAYAAHAKIVRLKDAAKLTGDNLSVTRVAQK